MMKSAKYKRKNIAAESAVKHNFLITALVMAAAITIITASSGIAAHCFYGLPCCSVSAADENVQDGLTSGQTSSAAYMIYEADTKQTLQRLNTEEPADCSLLSRLMTCLVVLEESRLSVTDYITPKQNSISASERYELLTSNQYMVDHLIKSIILCNADNAARVLAEQVSSDSSAFAALMNKKADEIGMLNTYFTSADGAQDGIQRTTVKDMTLFWAYAMNNSQFRNAASSPVSHIWGGTAVVNECKLLKNASFPSASLTAGVYALYDTEKSLGTTMFYITTGTSNTALPPTRIALVMTGTADEYAYDLGMSYMENAIANFVKTAIVTKNDIITTIDMEGGTLNIIADDSAYCMMPSDITSYIENISYNIVLDNISPSAADNSNAATLNDITPPIEQGTVIGTANYLLKDGSVVKVSISAGNTIRSDNKTVNKFYKALQENTDIFIIISVLISIELLLAIFIAAGKLRARRMHNDSHYTEP